MTIVPPDLRKDRVKRLALYGLLSRWDELAHETWIDTLLDVEERERQRRSLERRFATARLGRFKPMADFDWNWPTSIDRHQVQDLFTLRFVNDGLNAVLVGPNGVGKSMIALNLAHDALLRGYTVRYLTASALLNDLAAQEGARALQRRLQRYAAPALLIVDELGYLSYDHRHADLLFEVVSRRYGLRSILLTTNKAFAEWNEVFPNASSVVTLVDRLVHHSEIVPIEGESYRLKEAKERATLKAKERGASKARNPEP